MNERLLAVTKLDEQGRRSLAKLSAFRLIEVLVQRCGGRLRPVPEDVWAADADSALVKCPCGHELTIELLAFPAKCACDRRFFYDGTGVYSLRPPTPSRQREEQAAA